MEFKELIAELDKLKDTEDYTNYIGGLLTADRVSKYLESEDGKKLIQPTLDKNFTKGLETWKTKNLQSLVDIEIKKRFPEEDPSTLELKKLKADFEAMKLEAARKDLLFKASKAANEKGLPVEIVDYLIGEDEDATAKNLEAFEKVFNAKLSESVEAKLKGNTHIPANDKSEQLSGVEKAFYDRNPGLITKA